ncbi:DMT family transporter [Solidesulfovibrio sp.]|uniref:DMT family transporter n=1 Tax=Solidesulfovibrio sp. TaxID=2910990 RepID=UPI002623A673|nr:DMT family transporter [Solidesulfovibrio sp.]
MRKTDFAVAAALAVTLFAWGLSYVWTKIALAEMGPFTLACARFSLATGLFALAFAVSGRRPRPLSRADHGRLFLLSLLQPVGHFAFETCGLVLTSASAAACIVAAIPLAVVGLDAALGRGRAGLSDLARVAASMAGVACVVAGGAGPGPGGGKLAGDLLMVGAVAATAGYVVAGGALARRLDALTVTFVQLAWGAVLFAPACAFELAGRGWPQLTASAAAALAALTVLASFAAFACYNFVLARLPAARAALWLNAVPVVTALAAWAALGERLSPLEAAGGVMVLAAVAAPASGGKSAGAPRGLGKGPAFREGKGAR